MFEVKPVRALIRRLLSDCITIATSYKRKFEAADWYLTPSNYAYGDDLTQLKQLLQKMDKKFPDLLD